MNIGNRIKKLRMDHGLSQEELGEKLHVTRQTVSNWENNKNYPELSILVNLAELFDITVDEILNEEHEDVCESNEKMKRKMIGSRIGLLLAIVIFLLSGYALWQMSFPNDMELHKGCVYADSLTGSVVEVNLKHHESGRPWECFFGTKTDSNAVLDSFRSQDVILDITDLSNKEDNAERYLFKVNSELGVLYQELYAFHFSFPKHKRERSYVLRDSIKRIFRGEEEFDILFPCSILDYDAGLLRDEADEFWIYNSTWSYHEEFLGENETIMDFLLQFYNETDLYDATAEGSKIVVTFDRGALDGKLLNQYQKMRLERLYKGIFVIEIDNKESTLTVELIDE